MKKLEMFWWGIILWLVAWLLASAAFKAEPAPVPVGQQAQRGVSEDKASSI